MRLEWDAWSSAFSGEPEPGEAFRPEQTSSSPRQNAPRFGMTASRDSGIAANRRLGIPAFRGGAKKQIGEPGSSPICFFDFACRDLPQGRGGHAKTPHARCGFQSAVRSVSGGVILPLSPFLRSSSEGCKRNSGESHRCGVTGWWVSLKFDPLDSALPASHHGRMKVKSKGLKLDFTTTAAGVVSKAIGEDLFTGEPLPLEEPETEAAKRGRLGGLVGGKARAEKLSAARRRQIAKKAAKSRWKT